MIYLYKSLQLIKKKRLQNYSTISTYIELMDLAINHSWLPQNRDYQTLFVPQRENKT